MKIKKHWLYVETDQTVAHYKSGKEPSNFDYAIGSGGDGQFSESQIAHLLEQMQSNQKRTQRP